MIFKKDENKFKFISTVPHLTSIEECLPKPASRYLPEWWSSMERINPKFTIDATLSGNAKNCPALPDFFSQGYILPMWTDTVLSWNKEREEYAWKTDNEIFTWSIHSQEQFLKHVPFTFLGKKGQFLFRSDCPWKFVTPKGYSTYQLPLFYHFTNDFTVLPGIVDTDVHPIINQQVLLLADEGEVFIKRGTPIAQYIPFKREKHVMETREANEKDLDVFAKQDLNFNTKFHGSNPYLKLKRD